MKEKIAKYLQLFLFMFALIVGICSTEISAEAKARYKLNKTSIRLQKGTTYQLKSNYKGKKIKWASKNKKVAVVNRKGKVTAKKNGSTYITCKIGKKTLKCKVRVFTAKMSVSKKTIYVKTTIDLKLRDIAYPVGNLLTKELLQSAKVELLQVEKPVWSEFMLMWETAV